MFDWLEGLKLTPFMLMTVNGKSPAINMTRIIEAAVIGVVTAVFTTIGTVQVITYKLERLERDVQKVSTMAEDAVKTQQQIVPMRNLQVSNMQQDIQDLQHRIKALEEARNRKQ